MKVKTNLSFEIIVVDDKSIDGCCVFLHSSEFENRVRLVKSNGIGAAMARNLGADHASGDFLVVCDAHLFFEDYWLNRLIEPIQSDLAHATNPGIADANNPTNVGYGYSWNDKLEPIWNHRIEKPFPSPHLAGGCLAISRNVFFDIGGFERGFKIWGREDEEISLKLWLFGYRCYVIPQINVLHVFRSGSPPFRITYDDLNYNMMRMAYSHFNEERIEKCKKYIKYSDPSHIESLLLESNILEQRRHYFDKRLYDDGWFMNKFGIPF